mgnify:FL=1
MNINKTVIITGIAGFIGYNLAIKLCQSGYRIIGIDNLSSDKAYYISRLRIRNLGIAPKSDILYKSTIFDNLLFYKLDLYHNWDQVCEILQSEKIFAVCHLAARTGVRDASIDAQNYILNNIWVFQNISQYCADNKIFLLYASSSSVYGDSLEIPHNEGSLLRPKNIYALTKFTDELIAKQLSNSGGLKSIGLRFFSVYGPWGRPDMAYFIFLHSIINNKPIQVLGDGTDTRDYTFVGDIVYAIEQILKKYPDLKYGVYNIGNGHPISVNEVITHLEEITNKKAIINYQESSSIEMRCTNADNSLLFSELAWTPNTTFNEGINKFVDWALSNKEIWNDFKISN